MIEIMVERACLPKWILLIFDMEDFEILIYLGVKHGFKLSSMEIDQLKDAFAEYFGLER